VPSALEAMPTKASMSAMASGCRIEWVGGLNSKSCSALLIDVSADFCSSFSLRALPHVSAKTEGSRMACC